MNWQPIDTAPKDGTRILIHSEDGGIRAAWYDKNFAYIAPKKLRGGWTDDSIVSFDDFEVAEFFPSHWMPLPEPPKQ
jgi:hypothetical protein